MASLLLPALKKAKDAGKKIACSGSQRQIGLAVNSYVGDFNGYYMYRELELDDSGVCGYGPTQAWAYQLLEGNYLPVRKPLTEVPGSGTFFTEKCDIAPTCPSRVRFAPDWVSEWVGLVEPDYMMNGVAYTYSPSFKRGGLAELQPGMLGCKVGLLKTPSSFCILTERDDKKFNRGIVLRVHTELQTKALPSSKTTPTSCDTHGNASNYLFADGHVSTVTWRDVRWAMFMDDGEGSPVADKRVGQGW